MSAVHRREVVRGAVLGSSPWTHAPLLLLRRPSVFLAIVAAVAVLAVAAASGLLFLSTLGTASLQAQAADDCPEYSLPAVSTILTGTPTGGLPAVDPGRLRQATAAGISRFRAVGLPAPYPVAVGSSLIQATTVHLFSRSGALAHVTKLTAGDANGTWFPNVFAAKLHLRPGDSIRTTSGASIRVAGIYQDLAPSPFALSHLPRYWCTWSPQIVPTVATDAAIAGTPANYQQGPLLITDEATVVRASEGALLLSWYAPLSHSHTSLSGFDVAQQRAEQAAGLIGADIGNPAVADDHLAMKIAVAHRAKSGVSASIVPIDLAGVLVAALLVAGAGVFWATHRSREIRLLVARGVGPVPLAAKAVLETVLPAGIGLLVGYYGAFALVRTVGPSALFDAGVPLRALGIASAAVLLGLALIGGIGGIAARDRVLGMRSGWLRHVPWELGLLGLAMWMGLLIRSGSGVTVDHTVVHVSPLTFTFPILGSTAVLLLAGRIVAWTLPRVGRRARHAGIAGYFALRRIAGSRAVAVALIVGTALPCCLLTYGSTVTTGVSNEVSAKFRTNLGAEHVLSVYGIRAANPDTEGHGALVSVYQSEPTLPHGVAAYVLAVEPASFAEFAFTTSAQHADLARLHPVGAGRAVPAILVNAPDRTDASSVSILTSTLPLQIVARSAVFPGLRNGSRPMLVIDRSAIGRIDPNADRLNQLWTSDAQLSAALALLKRDGFSVLTELTSQLVIGTTGLLPVTWIFGYLQALAVLIGVVAIAGLVFALAARTRRRTVSYVLSRRMGMTRTAHLRSLLIELSLVVGFGWLAGSGVGAAAFAFVYRALDVYPALPPPASFVVPTTTLLLTALVTALVVLLASVSTHTLAERARPAEILRLE
ncbi:MAG: hypothetical protein ACR2LF_08790 [Jatrophihabitantaceae bacterium]